MQVRCTVCDLEVEAATAITLEDDRHPYAFCCERCLQEFDDNPELYVEDWEDDDEQQAGSAA